jgi:peptidoglycan L-alanyl-D-glutamate endopeptidase CwlK
MDCDVDLQKFADQPFVIERPAGESLLGDHAGRFMAKKGFRLEFGNSAAIGKAALSDLEAILPPGVSVVDRQTASVKKQGAGTIVAMPSRATAHIDKKISGQAMQMEALAMLGHSVCGADRVEAATFAAMFAMQKKFEDATLVYFADNSMIDEGKKTTLKELIARRNIVEAKLAFLGHGTSQISSLAKHTVATSGVQLASLNPNVEEFSSPLFGPKTESDIVDGAAKFQPKEFGSASVGPSYLNPELFNEKSLKEIQGVHPDLLAVVNRAREICPITFEVVPDNGGLRDLAEQRRLTKAGKSKAKLGRHTIGHAIDLVPSDVRGRPNFKDMKGFDAIRNAMETAANELGVPVQWGGNWKRLVDKPHFELDRKVYPGPGEEPDVGAVLTAFR